MIVILYLHNGKVVMGKMNITNENSIELDDALVVNYTMDEDFSPALYFVKYCPFVESKTVSFMNNDIMHIFKDPLPDFLRYYNNNVKSILYGKKTRKRVTKKDEDTEIQELLALAEKKYGGGKIH
jgi:hypothetical protein